MNFTNKRILITAGPTWVAIDNVRVISNMASGETGVLLADELAGLGAKVTLVLGPVKLLPKNKKVKVISFHFFDELKTIICRQLKKGKFSAVIHSAAVSDYAPIKVNAGKIKSNLKKLQLDLRPTPKIIDLIKKINSGIFLAGFKFQPQAGKLKLLESAKLLMRHSRADIVVANTISAKKYQAYIVSPGRTSEALFNKRQLVGMLVEKIGEVE